RARRILSSCPTRRSSDLADHRYLMEIVAREAGFTAPVALDLDEFYSPLVKVSRKGPVLPVDGVLVRDWDPDNRRFAPGFQLGMRDRKSTRLNSSHGSISY